MQMSCLGGIRRHLSGPLKYPHGENTEEMRGHGCIGRWDLHTVPQITQCTGSKGIFITKLDPDGN